MEDCAKEYCLMEDAGSYERVSFWLDFEIWPDLAPTLSSRSQTPTYDKLSGIFSLLFPLLFRY